MAIPEKDDETAEEEPLDVFDLPQLCQKPTTELLLSTLAVLSLQPLSWDRIAPQQTKRKVRSEGVPSYLTKIISSPLAWIDYDDEKEQIWGSASQRLAERSGRTGMGAIERAFNIPLSGQAIEGTADSVAIKIHEPALTGDNLGLKTWASSYLLAKRLARMKDDILPELGDGEQILELGSGTGLVGLAAATVFRRHTILTDLPEIVSNVEHNIGLNAAMLDNTGARVRSAVLDWNEPSTLSLDSSDTNRHHPARSFGLVLAADPVYSELHPRLFAQAVDAQLNRDANARLVIELPLRDAYVAERQDLVARLEARGLERVAEGEEIGYDDWGNGEELDEVRCWWSVWGWKSKKE